MEAFIDNCTITGPGAGARWLFTVRSPMKATPKPEETTTSTTTATATTTTTTQLASALSRDRELAFGSGSAQGRLAPLLALLDEHVQEPPAGAAAKNLAAADLGAGTAVFTTAFAEHFPWLQWAAVDTRSSETEAALDTMCAECEPEEIVGGKRLCFVSEGPCVVREGDVVRLRGLQQRQDLNGKLGTVCAREGAERFSVQLEASTTKVSLKPTNLAFERPGYVAPREHLDTALRPGGSAHARTVPRACRWAAAWSQQERPTPTEWQTAELARLRSEVSLSMPRSIVREVASVVRASAEPVCACIALAGASAD